MLGARGGSKTENGPPYIRTGRFAASVRANRSLARRIVDATPRCNYGGDLSAQIFKATATRTTKFRPTWRR